MNETVCFLLLLPLSQESNPSSKWDELTSGSQRRGDSILNNKVPNEAQKLSNVTRGIRVDNHMLLSFPGFSSDTLPDYPDTRHTRLCLTWVFYLYIWCNEIIIMKLSLPVLTVLFSNMSH